MSYNQLTDDDLIEAFYASDLLKRLSRGDEPLIVLDALRSATDCDRTEIAGECASKAIDISAGRYGDEEVEPGLDEWSKDLRRIAEELRTPAVQRNAGPPRSGQ